MGVKLALRGVIVDERDGAGEGGTPALVGSSFLSRFDRSMFWCPCLLSNHSCSQSASLRQLRLALCLGALHFGAKKVRYRTGWTKTEKLK
jgi:hypothetical protein